MSDGSKIKRTRQRGSTVMTTGTDQRFTAVDGIPSRDGPELAALMEAVRRLARDRAAAPLTAGTGREMASARRAAARKTT
jgi:hypothetical protein